MSIPNPTQIGHHTVGMLSAKATLSKVVFGTRCRPKGRPTVPVILTNQSSVSTHTPSEFLLLQTSNCKLHLNTCSFPCTCSWNACIDFLLSLLASLFLRFIVQVSSLDSLRVQKSVPRVQNHGVSGSRILPAMDVQSPQGRRRRRFHCH